MEIDFWKGKRVLISGASGFIGSHLSKRLMELGAYVVATQHLHKVEYADTVYPVDLTISESVQKVVDKYGSFDVVFHLASQALVGDGTMFARNTLETNINGTINLLEALMVLEDSLKAVVVASSDKVFGRHKHLPYHEDFALKGNEQIYEVSKLCEDNIAQAYFHSFDMPISITRFGNVYGPRDKHYSRLIPGVINDYLNDKSPAIRSDGQQYRDYVYVDDVVDGYLKLAEWRHNNPKDATLAFNFGTGKPSRVLDVVGMISEHFPKGKAFEVTYGAEDEISRQYLDSSLAHKTFGWKPTVSLSDGIRETVLWYKQQYGNDTK